MVRLFDHPSSPRRLFNGAKNALALQPHLPNYDLLVVRLRAHSHQEFKAYYAFHDVYNPCCNKLLPVLVLERDSEVQGYVLDFHKRRVVAQNSGHIFVSLLSLIPSTSLVTTLAAVTMRWAGTCSCVHPRSPAT